MGETIEKKSDKPSVEPITEPDEIKPFSVKKQIQNPEIGIGTNIINHSYDNEKDQHWHISYADKENVTISQKKWGTRNPISPITMKWDDFKEMIVDDIIKIEGFEEENKRFIGIAITNFIKEQTIKEREEEISKRDAEIAKKSRYEKVVKNSVEQRKKQRIDQRQKAKEEAKKAQNELDAEMKKEREKDALMQVIELDTELAENTKDKKQKSVILARIELNQEILKNL